MVLQHSEKLQRLNGAGKIFFLPVSSFRGLSLFKYRWPKEAVVIINAEWFHIHLPFSFILCAPIFHYLLWHCQPQALNMTGKWLLL